MAEAVNMWKRDSRGDYFERGIGEKKDASINLADYWPNTETLTSVNAVWSAPAGVTIAGNVTNGLIAKAYFLGVTAGEYDCSLIATSDSGNYIEPIPFKVIVK